MVRQILSKYAVPFANYHSQVRFVDFYPITIKGSTAPIYQCINIQGTLYIILNYFLTFLHINSNSHDKFCLVTKVSKNGQNFHVSAEFHFICVLAGEIHATIYNIVLLKNAHLAVCTTSWMRKFYNKLFAMLTEMMDRESRVAVQQHVFLSLKSVNCTVWYFFLVYSVSIKSSPVR